MNQTDATSEDAYKCNQSAMVTDSGIGCQQMSFELQVPYGRINSAGTTTSGSFSSRQTVFTNPDSQHPGAPISSPSMGLRETGRLGIKNHTESAAGGKSSVSVDGINEKPTCCCTICGLPILSNQLRGAQSYQRINENCVSSDSGISSSVHEAADYRVAVKVESNRQPRQVLRMEVAVLRRLQGKPNVCTLFGCGLPPRFNYMVLSLQIISVTMIRRSFVLRITGNSLSPFPDVTPYTSALIPDGLVFRFFSTSATGSSNAQCFRLA
ncbi:unnamed protein product [Echinostoma caproni]|uniref:Protein kinase domain-containing protein n=1 Tax=Echinostoma caproni TaxID=27848 RepID=A0A183AF94_9TREM|nr:unnamed protein product [Echinostoma caproni]